MTVKITLEMLEDKGACEDQRYLFTEHFPNGVIFESQNHAIEMCTQFAQIFYFWWAADKFLGEDARAEYRGEIVSVLADIWDEYLEALALEPGEYKKETALSRAKRNKAVATEFAKAYWQQESAK